MSSTEASYYICTNSVLRANIVKVFQVLWGLCVEQDERGHQEVNTGTKYDKCFLSRFPVNQNMHVRLCMRIEGWIIFLCRVLGHDRTVGHMFRWLSLRNQHVFTAKVPECLLLHFVVGFQRPNTVVSFRYFAKAHYAIKDEILMFNHNL